MAEHAFGIKTLGDAVMLRAAVIALLEAASVEPDPEQRKKMLTFVVAGGGSRASRRLARSTTSRGKVFPTTVGSMRARYASS